MIYPSLLPDNSWCDDARYVIDTLIVKGSLVAPLRKLELEQLERKLSALTPTTGNGTPPQFHDDDLQEAVIGEATQEHVADETGWDYFAANVMAGLTPGGLLNLAEQFDVNDINSFLY